MAGVPLRHPVATPLDSSDGTPVADMTDMSSELQELDLYRLREEPFVLPYQESTLREMTDQIFKKAGFTPHVLFETSNNATIATMIHAEMCCGLIPEYYARNSPYGIRYFTLPDNPAWNIMACCHKNRYISKSTRDFIALAEEFWKKEL